MKIALFTTATGNYIEFIEPLINSAKKYFFSEKDVTFILFTDRPTELDHLKKKYENKLIINTIASAKFPQASMLRCANYIQFIETCQTYKQFDYCYAIDADALFANYINDSILYDSIAVRHCAYINTKGTFETNINSACYVPMDYDGPYLGGGFYGGNNFNFYKINYSLNKLIEMDLSNNITPLWHDESALNRYFYENPPQKILSPAFHYPGWENNTLNPYIKSLWEKQETYIKNVLKEKIPIQPKIIFLEKTFANKGVEYYRS